MSISHIDFLCFMKRGASRVGSHKGMTMCAEMHDSQKSALDKLVPYSRVSKSFPRHLGVVMGRKATLISFQSWGMVNPAAMTEQAVLHFERETDAER